MFIRASVFMLACAGSLACAQDLVAPVTVNGDPGGFETLRVNGTVRAGVGVWSPYMGIFAPTPLSQTGGQQQYMLDLGTQTGNGDRLRAFANRKVAGANWDTAEWYLGRYVDVTNMFQLVWGTQGGTWNFRIGRGYPASSDLSISYDGKVLVGTDPGGSELMRIGGNARVGTELNVGLGSQVNGTSPSVPAFIAGARSMAPTGFSYALRGDNDQGARLVAFVNGSGRSADGGVNAATVRNDGGNLNLGGGAGVVNLWGTSTIIGQDPSGSGILRVGGGADIKGTVRTMEVVVTPNGWSDYVFDPHYELMPLNEVQRQIEEHRHLPGVPSSAEVARDGVSVGDMQAMHMRKIEELTLYAIEADRTLVSTRQELRTAQGEIADLVQQNRQLNERLARIEAALAARKE